MPARKIGVKTSSVSSRFFSLKMLRLVSTESLLETYYCFLWELCPKVLSYCEQPVTLKFKNLKYTPDFELDFGKVKVLVEIKPLKFFVKALLKVKIFETHFICSSYGYVPKIFLFSEKDLPPLQIEYLRNFYFQLLNSASQNFLNFHLFKHYHRCQRQLQSFENHSRSQFHVQLTCPFIETKHICPIKRKIFSTLKVLEQNGNCYDC